MKFRCSLFMFFFVVLIYSQEKPSELSLLFIGDFMGHMDQINAAYNTKTKSYDYSECFKYVKKYLADADVTIGNLEVTLGVKPYSGYPAFSSPASYASAIKNAGIDALMTANNHSCDKGKRGLERTIKILDTLKIQHTGTFISKESKAKKPALIIKKNDFKIALLNYTYGTNGIKPRVPNVVNYLNKKTIIDDVKRVKKINVDEIIAFVHWGTQYKSMPSKDQKFWLSFFKSQGIRIVIGAHPHVLQPIIFDKNNKNFVAYSLGNFISHQRTFPRDGGAILKLILQKEDKKISIKEAKYKFTWVYEPIEKGQKKYYILPITDFEEKPYFFKVNKHFLKMKRFVNHGRALFKKENLGVFEY